MRNREVLKISLASRCGKLSRYNFSAHLGMGIVARLDERFRFGIVFLLGLFCWHLRSSLFVRCRCKNDWGNRRFNEHPCCSVLRNIFSCCHWYVLPWKTYFEKHQRKRREMEQSSGSNVFIGKIFIRYKCFICHAARARR